ncbi:alpha/beta hydrolase [Herbidospora mongoliensis]|uniref:alpha/beta hydrolase n=1 Tax=Herbidospora mongoliensis TaxID=688067 RepID=UPI000A5FAEAB|nr:alpha/beta hydrolase [Herbidospora mongoliensis]
MRLLASRLEEAAQEITRLQGGSVIVGLPITAPPELAHYEAPLRNLVEWCHSSAAEIRKRAAIAAEADLIGWDPSGDNTARDALMTAAAGGFDDQLAGFDALGEDGDVAAFFAALTPGQALAVALARAQHVGARAGVPFELRYAANRQLVRQARAEALRVGDKGAVDRYTRLLNPDRQLLLFDPRALGKIAEVKGNLATAKNVSIFVPGTGNHLANYLGGSGETLEAIHKAAAGLSAGTATILWMGSPLPQGLGGAMFDLWADRSAPKLRGFFDDLRLQPEVRTTLIGHSYGSTVTGHAVKEGLHPDNLIAVASPGWGVTSASELNAPETKLFAMRHTGDLIKLAPPAEQAIGFFIPVPDTIAGHGADPVFMPGVERLSSGSEAVPFYDIDSDAHSDYFGGSEAGRRAAMNMAKVIAGVDHETYEEAKASL